LSQKLSDLQGKKELSIEEKRAIWGLADLLEYALAENNFGAKPQAEWENLINQAKEFMKTIRIDYVD
jgi:hypothetical protein